MDEFGFGTKMYVALTLGTPSSVTVIIHIAVTLIGVGICPNLYLNLLRTTFTTDIYFRIIRLLPVSLAVVK